MSKMNFTTRVLVATFGICPLACACAVAPTVKYSLIPASSPRPLNENEFDAYFLQGSKIRIAAQTDKQKPTYDVSSIPTEATANKITVQYDDPFWSTTSVTITKVANRDVVSEIGSQVTDHRVAYINAGLGIVKTVITIVAAGPAGPNDIVPKDLPIEIDLTKALSKGDARGEMSVTTGDSRVTIDLGPIPPDAVEFSSMTFPFSSHAFFYSACRTAQVQARVVDGTTVTTIDTTVKVADPNYLQRVNLPSKGKITMHTECGASVATDSNTGVSSDADLLQAISTQAQAISDAVKASNKAKK
jgi:hypothetical protein